MSTKKIVDALTQTGIYRPEAQGTSHGMYEIALAVAETIIDMETSEPHRAPTPPRAHRTGPSIGPLATSTPSKDDDDNDYVAGLHQLLQRDKKPAKVPRGALDLPAIPGIQVQVYPSLRQLHDVTGVTDNSGTTTITDVADYSDTDNHATMADDGTSSSSGSYVTAAEQLDDVAQMADVDTIESLGFEDVDLDLTDAILERASHPTYQEQLDHYRNQQPGRRGSPVPDETAARSFNPDFDPQAEWAAQIQPAATLPDSTPSSMDVPDTTPPPPWDPRVDLSGFFDPGVWPATAEAQVAAYRRRHRRAFHAEPVDCWQQWRPDIERLVAAVAPAVEHITTLARPAVERALEQARDALRNHIRHQVMGPAGGSNPSNPDPGTASHPGPRAPTTGQHCAPPDGREEETPVQDLDTPEEEETSGDMAQRRKPPAFAAALAAAAVGAAYDEWTEAKRQAAYQTGLVQAVWDLTPDGDRQMKKEALDRLLKGSSDSRMEMKRLLQRQGYPEDYMELALQSKGYLPDGSAPPGKRGGPGRGDLEATDATPADTDRADRTREPATREFSSSVGPGMKARASPAKLESGHREPFYVRLYCVMMPIALASTMATVLWYIGVFDQLVITYNSQE